MKIEKVCAGCGKSFSIPFRTDTERVGKIQFCSIACTRKRKIVECVTCKTEFEVKQCSTKKYCSSPCYQAARDKGVTVKCEVCSKEYSVPKSRKDSARWCSRECQSNSSAFKAEVSERCSGDKHWRWMGGKYGGSYVYKNTTGGRTHRQIFTEYMISKVPDHSFLVGEPGSKKLSQHIHVHHIDGNPRNNSLDNLLAVTIDAHAKIHHSGRKPSPWECWPNDLTI